MSEAFTKTVPIVLAAVLVFGTTAHAEIQPEEWKELADRMKAEPQPGRDVAKARAPQWCSEVTTEATSPGAIARTLDGRVDTAALLRAAAMTCAWPKQPAVHEAVQVIEQTWINWTNLPTDQALSTFKARLQADRYKSEKTKLCKALEVSSEARGEEKAFGDARRMLFGCKDDDALWTNSSVGVDEAVSAYLDATVTPDELARLAWLTSRTRYIFNEHDTYFDKKLLAFVVDQLDLQTFDEKAALAQLDAAPYAGNTFARAVVLESIGNLRAAKAAIQVEIDAKSKDADWKELLVTAPQRGIAEWTKQTAPYKDELARSAAFEKKFFAPSRSEARGCWKPLLADVAKVIKPLDRADPAKLQIGLSQPVPSLLFSRLAACAAVDQDGAWSSVLVTAAKELRFARGPRAAAYYAAFDALANIKADRSGFPIDQGDLRLWKTNELLDEASTLAIRAQKDSKIDSMGFVADTGESVVQSVKKTADGVAVTFVAKRHQQMLTECKPTNRILKIEADGTLVYEHICHPKGLVWVDDTVGGIVVPEVMAANIKAGSIVRFQAARGKAPDRKALPLEVYADKSKKKLVTWNGLGL
jgi:hypothetical protein